VWEMGRDAGRYGESPQLFEAARRALESQPVWDRAPELLAQRTGRRARKPALAAGLGLALAGLAAGAAPATSWHAATALAGLGDWRDAWRRVPPPARLAEFRITYRYPDYTGRPARTMSSASGRVRCLPGTEVQIQVTSLEPVADAALLLGRGEDPDGVEEIAAEADGRSLTAHFVAGRPGTYRFRTIDPEGTTREERRGHPIDIEVDDPPDVTLIEPTESPLEVNEKDTVHLSYRARDDYGLGEVAVRWRVLGTSREGREPLRGDAGRTAMSGRGTLDLAELELEPGDRVSYSVEVLDNDSVNGPKTGASRTQELRIYSRRDHHARVLAEQEEALDELVHVLGDHLEEPFAASTIASSLPPAQARIERTTEAEALLREAEEASREDPLGRPEVAEAFVRARNDVARRRRASQSAMRRLRRMPESERDPAARFLVGAEARMVRVLEEHSVYLADLLNDQRLIDAEALADQLREEQMALREALEAYKAAPTPAKRAELGRAIERIQSRIRELSRQLADLESSVPTEYVNREALSPRQNAEDLDRMQALLEAGELDEALEQVDQMLGQTERMIAELREGRKELGSREYSEIAQRAREIWQELEDMKMRQRELARRTEAISKTVRERSQERVDASEAFIEKQTQRLRRAKADIDRAAPEDARPAGDAFDAVEQRLDDGIRALEAKDFGAAREVLERGRDRIRELERETERRARQLSRFGSLFGDSEATARAAEALGRARPRVERVIEDLEAMVPDPQKMLSKEERSTLDEMARMQGELAERAEGLGEQLAELGEQLPIVGPKVSEKIGEAQGAMEGARQNLEGYDAPGGLGEERRALESLAELREQLQQMGRDPSGGSGGVPLPFGGAGRRPRGNEGSGRDVRTAERVEIPQPEQFEAPAEFRRDILEAAKEGTVERFRDAVRRYYEELVK